MNAEVIIPWRGGCPYRERALAWVTDRYHAAGFPVTVAELASEGPWVKAKAVTPAVEASNAGVVVVADADVWCDGITDAVTNCKTWAIPHQHVRRLTEEATEAVYAGGDLGGPLVEKSYSGKQGGGIVVIRRDAYLETPLDPRFEGWGREDESWGWALNLILGLPWRAPRPLWHLWHPPQPRPTRSKGSEATEALFDRYRRTRKAAEMRQLVAEITACRC